MRASLITFVVASIFLAAAPTARAQDIDRLQNLAQQEFRLLSEDLGGALSYKPQTPTTPLGITGFDIGIAVTAAKIKNTAAFESATSDSIDATIPIPTLRLHKGLPLNFDVGVMYAAIPGSNISYYGGELRWAFVPGNLALPAIGLRGSLTKLNGVDQLDFDTKGLDVSISKGFGVVTPYAGVGRVWVESKPNTSNLRSEEFTLDKIFAGIGIKLGAFNLNLEADKTGDVNALSVKTGIRF
ncbi:MAG: hypothetical protein M3544_04255 [Pseudomonadota bacterium]|nr:hypothetical protein [Pseudomonadota bacterium]